MTQTTKLRRITAAAAVAYGTLLLLIAFWPTPVDEPVAEPIGRALRSPANPDPSVLTYDLVESLANVALFIPVGFLLVALLGTQRWWLAVLTGVATSIVIEAAQYAFLAARFATIKDVYANSAGTVVGTGIGVVAVVMVSRASAKRRGDALRG